MSFYLRGGGGGGKLIPAVYMQDSDKKIGLVLSNSMCLSGHLVNGWCVKIKSKLDLITGAWDRP